MRISADPIRWRGRARGHCSCYGSVATEIVVSLANGPMARETCNMAIYGFRE